MALKVSTRRSLSQIIYRHTPQSLISLEESGVYGMVKEIRAEPDDDVNKDILLRRLLNFVQKWSEDSGGRIKGFDPDMSLDSLVALRPGHSDPEFPSVFCEIFPPAFQCVKSDCKVYADSYSNDFNGVCKRCGGSLKQIKYVWYHQCGKLFPFGPLKDKKCPTHGRAALYLNDTGRFSSSSWRCRDCSYNASLGMIPCSDEQCKSNTPQPGENRFMSGSVWNDPWVYYTQQLSFVNLSGHEIDKIVNHPDAKQLLMDSLTGRIPAGGSHLSDHANLKVNCQNCNAELPFSAKFCTECGFKQATVEKPEIANDEKPESISVDDDLATFASLRDLERTVSIRDSIRHTSPQETHMAELSEQIKSIGLSDILLINDLPLANVAIGYSRLKSGPPAWLNSFPVQNDQVSKTPLYTNCVTSEALMVQLSPTEVVEWIVRNDLIDESRKAEITPLDDAEATLWLTELLSKDDPDDEEARLCSALRSLLHTYAHQFLQLIGAVSGLESSSLGELLLVEAMSFIIYSGDSDIGGLSATFSQSLDMLTSELKDFLRICKFDPSCSKDDHGVCVGCLYVARGCGEFNENLSRAYLFGGDTGHSVIKSGFLDLR